MAETGPRPQRIQGILAALVALVVGAAAYWGGAAQWLDSKIYDAATRMADTAPLAELVLVTPGVDTPLQTAEQHARLIDRLAAAGAKTIVYTLPLPPSSLAASAPAATGQALHAPDPLAASLHHAGNVLLVAPSAQGTAAADWPVWMERFTRPAGMARPSQATSLGALPQAYATQAAGVGHGQAPADADGVVRSVPLLLPVRPQMGRALPSLAVLATLHSMHLDRDAWQAAADGRSLQWSGARVLTDPGLHLRPRMDVASRKAWSQWSAAEVLQGTVGSAALAHKLVLVGPAAANASTASPTQVLAHAITSLRQGRAFHIPAWAWLSVLVCAGAGWVYLAWLLPRLGRRIGAMSTAALVLAIAGAEWALLAGAGLWLGLMAVALGLVAGQLAWLAWRPRTPDPAMHETERLMGQALRGRGQWDAAFAHWQPLPMNAQLQADLHHLAQDCEKQKQWSLAKAVYKHLLRHDRSDHATMARYQRVRRKLRQQMQGSAGVSAMPPAVTVPPPAPASAVRLLGRYQLEHELGRGPQSIVCRARDLQTGHAVAIKTLAPGQAPERFLRAAEAAAHLRHPAIVAIFDTGELQGQAYVAMELLAGESLAAHVDAAHLLPVRQVLTIAARVADALGHAHSRQVVHQGISPASLIWHAAKDSIKVTDFGMARAADARFLSPEQMEGKPADARSDLYSLGATLYQLLSGQPPSMLPTAPADIRPWRLELPENVSAILSKVLQKRPEDRYQTGEQFAQALREAIASLDAAHGHAPAAVVYDALRTDH